MKSKSKLKYKTSSVFKFIVFLSIFIFSCLVPLHIFALDIEKKTLPNGLILLHTENHSLPIVMVTLLIKVGQIHEPEDKAGIANLVVELLPEGTKHRTAHTVSEEIEFIGASLDTSASNDYVFITLSVLKKDLDKAFEIFSDILINPTFPQAELERKRHRIKGGLKQKEEDPAFLAYRAFKKEVFGEHPYARLIEGSVETIDSIKRDDLLKFYADHFLPNNSILSISGNLTSDEITGLLKKYLSEWKKTQLSPLNKQVFVGKNVKKLVQIDRDLTQANIILGHGGISRDNPDYYAVVVMNYILGGGGFSSRLMQSVREDMGLAYDIYSSFIPHKVGGMFQVEVQTKNEAANLVISEVLNQIVHIRKEHVSSEELSEAKSYLIGSFPRRLDTNREIADFLAIVEFYNLGLDYIEKYPEFINSVTKKDILRVAQKYLNPEDYVLVVVANQKKALIKN